jgi:hypothetical protein
MHNFPWDFFFFFLLLEIFQKISGEQQLLSLFRLLALNLLGSFKHACNKNLISFNTRLNLNHNKNQYSLRLRWRNNCQIEERTWETL